MENIEANALKQSDFNFSEQTNFYRGKVRDVYTVNEKLIMVASDRISAFDHVLPRAIPYKGQVLNQIAYYFLSSTRDIVPNWVLASPDPNVTIGLQCEPIKIEMVIRGYLAGHAWRTYKSGERVLCGVTMPEGMKESQRFPEPIITPATKAEEGHDEDISRQDILKKEIISEEDYLLMEQYTRALFARGTQMAAEQGLILVDTKYEFGKRNGQIYLIDEIHTPDSSRYYYSEGYTKRLAAGERQKQLSKEFVREWLMDHGFQGKDDQLMPFMHDEFVNLITERYIELYEKITGTSFEKADTKNILSRIESNVEKYLTENPDGSPQ